MKHTTEELLLANAVRLRVSELMLAKTLDMTDEEAAKFRSLPANGLIAEAMDELERIAQVIGTRRQSA